MLLADTFVVARRAPEVLTACLRRRITGRHSGPLCKRRTSSVQLSRDASSNRVQVGPPADGKEMENGVQSDSHEPAAPVQRGKSVVREA